MEMDWVTIPEFPNYLVSSNGDVVNASSGRWLAQSLTQEGVPKVGMVQGTRQYTRSVGVLVAEAFVHGRDDVSDTVVHLDGDRQNNRSYNLVWRPRWFACAYTTQFADVSESSRIGPLRDIRSGQRYNDVFECAIVHGLLMADIRKSLVMGKAVFPTLQHFEMV